jgi:hypothetical protein
MTILMLKSFRKGVSWLIMVLLFSVNVTSQGMPWAYVQLSTDMIDAHATHQNTDHFIAIFKDADMAKLAAQISTDQLRYTFWINIYNGYILHILRQNPKIYDDRRSFFDKKQINIAGQMFSFADIEHGILRRSEHPLKLGYGKKWCVSKIEKKLRVNKQDYRIHFALNCGAKSCPPVRAYRYETLDEDLDQSARQYLTSTTSCTQNKCEVTTLFSWFRGDFGGKKKVDDILMKYNIIPKTKSKYDISFAGYDWTLDLENFYKE